MKRSRCVRIIATLGPASSSREVIEAMFDAGADAFRINMSHTPHDQVKAYHRIIRDVEAQKERPIAILVDLQGPKLRISAFEKGQVKLLRGARFTLDKSTAKGDVARVRLPHPEIFRAVEPGHRLLVDDGKVELKIIAHKPDAIVTEVVVGGTVSDRKGVSLPDTMLPLSAMTEKDRIDLEFAVNIGVDWIALSFIQQSADVAQARKLAHGRAAIMAKIEKPSALAHLEEILELSDGLMVARGDLGVEMPLEEVPGIQKQITRLARKAGKPVVVATQMLESMITAPVPTRAEVSDVATAVFEGADAIMLSAESAVGEYPVKSIAMMDKIAISVESDTNFDGIVHAQRAEPEATSADAISAAVRMIAETLNLAGIICYTSSGSTALRVARERPQIPILALTPIIATGRRLAIVWGLHCVLTGDPETLDDMVKRACRLSYKENFATTGSRIIITAGVPLGSPGATNMLRIAFVGQDGVDLAG